MISEWFIDAANHTSGSYDPEVDELSLAGFTPVASKKVPHLYIIIVIYIIFIFNPPILVLFISCLYSVLLSPLHLFLHWDPALESQSVCDWVSRCHEDSDRHLSIVLKECNLGIDNKLPSDSFRGLLIIVLSLMLANCRFLDIKCEIHKAWKVGASFVKYTAIFLASEWNLMGYAN